MFDYFFMRDQNTVKARHTFLRGWTARRRGMHWLACECDQRARTQESDTQEGQRASNPGGIIVGVFASGRVRSKETLMRDSWANGAADKDFQILMEQIRTLATNCDGRSRCMQVTHQRKLAGVDPSTVQTC